jgi:hypothetical protein
VGQPGGRPARRRAPEQLLGTLCPAGRTDDAPTLLSLRTHIQAHAAGDDTVRIRPHPDQVIELRCSPIQGDDGIHTHGLILLEDVTEAERQSQNLVQAQARLLQAQHSARWRTGSTTPTASS